MRTSHHLQIPADIPTQPELLDGKPKVGATWLLLPEGKKLLNRPELRWACKLQCHCPYNVCGVFFGGLGLIFFFGLVSFDFILFGLVFFGLFFSCPKQTGWCVSELAQLGFLQVCIPQNSLWCLIRSHFWQCLICVFCVNSVWILCMKRESLSCNLCCSGV